MSVRIGVSYVRDGDRGQAYLEAIRTAGAEPVALATPRNCPRWPNQERAERFFDEAYPPIQLVHEVDGLLFTGGADVSPMLYHEPMDGSKDTNWSRDYVETAQFWLARRRRIPILGICRGLQFLNVVAGGSLVQHLPSADVHRDPTGHHGPWAHPARLAANSRLGAILAGAAEVDPTGRLTISVNSYHHQGATADRLAPTLGATALALDPEHPDLPAVVEACESADTTNGQEFLLAVQWHPERLNHPVFLAPGQRLSFPEVSERLFAAFVREATK